FRQLVGDVARFVRSIKSPNQRVHVAALSWGAKLAAAVDMLHPGSFSTMTLIAPGIFPRVMPGIGERIAIAVDSLLRPRALHPIPIEDEMFTSVPRYLEYIANDPLRLRKVTARFYLESVMLDRFLKKRGYQWTAPTQLLLAEHDAIIDNRRVQGMFESLNAQPKRINIYKGCNHSLQFEKPGDVAKDIVNWMRTASEH
ncbi:MAG: alpha/beta fold hydrolase, partial [Candidatus Hydrogenedentota bacterium]